MFHFKNVLDIKCQQYKRDHSEYDLFKTQEDLVSYKYARHKMTLNFELPQYI